jgi:predicted nucleotidyltransferase
MEQSTSTPKRLSIKVLKPELKRILSGRETVKSAYLFGSVATGVASDKSDIDIAIRLEPTTSSRDAHNIRLSLMDDLETIFHGPADVVILNSASLKLIHQVFKYGKPVYVQQPDEERAYRILKQKEYFDFQYFINKENIDLRSFYGA